MAKKKLTENQKKRAAVRKEARETLETMKSNAESLLAQIEELLDDGMDLEDIIDNIGEAESLADGIAEDAKTMAILEFPEDDSEESEAAE